MLRSTYICIYKYIIYSYIPISYICIWDIILFNMIVVLYFDILGSEAPAVNMNIYLYIFLITIFIVWVTRLYTQRSGIKASSQRGGIEAPPAPLRRSALLRKWLVEFNWIVELNLNPWVNLMNRQLGRIKYISIYRCVCIYIYIDIWNIIYIHIYLYPIYAHKNNNIV